MPTTTGMKASGFHNENSNEQRAALDAFLPWIEDALADLPLPSAGSPPIGLLDPGSSEGSNAIHAMMRIIEALRRRTDAPVWVFFNDLPSNDFNQLFANLFPAGSPMIPGADIVPVYFRTLAELTAPIEADADLAAVFRIEKKAVREVPAPFSLERANSSDVAVWAHSYAGFLRAFTEPILAAAIPAELSGSGIVPDICRRIEHRLAVDPDRYEFHYIALGVLLTRR
jgi:SAM dependent carboxyl methyltransferase